MKILILSLLMLGLIQATVHAQERRDIRLNSDVLPHLPVVKPLISKKLLLKSENSLGRDVPIPRDAKKISKSQFQKLHKAGNLKLISPKIKSDRVKLAKSKHKANKSFVKKRLRSNRRLLSRLTRKATGVTRSGKNYVHRIKDNRGRTQLVETMGEEFFYAEIANSLKQFSVKNNKLNLYNLVYSKLPRNFLNGARVKTPKQLARASTATINSNLKTLISKSKLIGSFILSRDLPPAARPKSCNGEIGRSSSTTTQGDQTGNSCAHHPDGIFKNVRYPLKWYATCVKNQGRRGTCVSFAATSAVESTYAVKTSKWYNFSEQNLYNAAKMKWYPSVYGDGLNTAGIMQDLVNRNYRFGYEYAWDYNPSYNRLKNDVNQTYAKSCQNYNGEHCSNTNHQGKKVCAKFLWFTYCGFVEQTAETSLKINGAAQIWNPLNTNSSVATARLASILKLPMVMSLPVTPSFDNAGVNGYATYVGANEGNRGWHAVAVLGVVYNSELPATAPQGAGGGYFVVKNSWGSCWKDAGYIYLPISWVKSYVGSLTAVTSI